MHFYCKHPNVYVTSDHLVQKSVEVQYPDISISGWCSVKHFGTEISWSPVSWHFNIWMMFCEAFWYGNQLKSSILTFQYLDDVLWIILVRKSVEVQYPDISISGWCSVKHFGTENSWSISSKFCFYQSFYFSCYLTFLFLIQIHVI